MDFTRIISPPTSRQLKGGKVTLQPGECVGEHVTDHKEELIIVQEGDATAIRGGEKILVRQGETLFIPAETVHNICNETEEALTYIYVVTLFPGRNVKE